MNINDPRILELKAIVTTLNDEFDMATVFHEVWKPASTDEALHGRMSHCYGGQAFLVVRIALRREMLLALARIWDSNRKSARMSKITALLREKGLVEALARDRAAGTVFSDIVDAMQTDMEGQAQEVLALFNKYSEGGFHARALEDLLRLRHEQLAHRQLVPSKSLVEGDFAQGVEQIYGDTSRLMGLLMGLVNATAYDPADTAQVFAHYAAKFWSGVQGEPVNPGRK